MDDEKKKKEMGEHLERLPNGNVLVNGEEVTPEEFVEAMNLPRKLKRKATRNFDAFYNLLKTGNF